MTSMYEWLDRRSMLSAELDEVQAQANQAGWTPALRSELRDIQTKLADVNDGLAGAVSRQQSGSGADAPLSDILGGQLDSVGLQRAAAGLDRSPHADALRSYLRSGDETELRAQGVGSGPDGGYTVPEGFRNTITETLQAFGGVRSLAEVINTEQGNALPWPTNDDTSNVGHRLDENTQDSEQTTTFGQKQLGAYTYTSKIVRASIQLMQDIAFPLDAWLAKKLGQRIARAQAPEFVTGTGSSQPQGLLTALTVGKTTASSSAITYGELVDVAHSVDPAYRESGVDGVAWIMNDSTFATLRKLVDGQSRPLIEPDVQRGLPQSLLGYPIKVDQAMPNIGASAKPIIFGNIRAAYVVRQVRDIQVLRLVERYADYLQVGFLGFQRADGLVQDVSAAKVLQMHS